jgi:hypothetical protein
VKWPPAWEFSVESSSARKAEKIELPVDKISLEEIVVGQ